ncbi:MAG: hypothetical protein OEZ59_06150, partial [Deltaproteobacteria bacterium]|nr:hypothetical protein [Deltaproteobacteria bacterium]
MADTLTDELFDFISSHGLQAQKPQQRVPCFVFPCGLYCSFFCHFSAPAPKNIPVALVLLRDRRYILPARKFQVVVMSTILADYGLPALGALSIGVKAFSMP